MRKSLLGLLLLIATTSAFAQLSVLNNGSLSAATSCPASGSRMLVGDAYNIGQNININSRIVPNNNDPAIGVLGLVETGPQTGSWGIGIYGESLARGMNLGVMGYICSSQNGAGICGTVGNFIPSFTNASYAGFFYGETRIAGTLSANSIINLSDINLKENIQSLSHGPNPESALGNILNMNVVRYNYKMQEINENDYISSDKISREEAIKEAKELNRLEAEKVHFGLIAQELQEIYPELVCKGQDGYWGVNYVELVPILIRSIQELKQELDDVKGQSKDKITRSGSFYDKDGNLASSNESILYQNSPNPFKEKTIIRFKLANDVQDASICFFDMNGRLLKKLPISSGMDSVSIGGYELGEGMFLYSLIVNGQEIDTKKMVITQ